MIVFKRSLKFLAGIPYGILIAAVLLGVATLCIFGMSILAWSQDVWPWEIKSQRTEKKNLINRFEEMH